jgi:hypothetical protein
MNTQSQKRTETTFSIDAFGQHIAHVTLYGNEHVVSLYVEDLHRILGDGWSPNWFLTSTGGRHRYVLVNARSPKGAPRSLTVARLVARVGKGQMVAYADGDRLNLRRDNLLVRRGTAWTPLEALQPMKGIPEITVETAARTKAPQMFTANFREGIELSERG